MPLYCCAPGCKNSQSMEGLSFYRIPTDAERRRRWITAVNRKNWQPSQYQRLCSDHFVGGLLLDEILHWKKITLNNFEGQSLIPIGNDVVTVIYTPLLSALDNYQSWFSCILDCRHFLDILIERNPTGPDCKRKMIRSLCKSSAWRCRTVVEVKSKFGAEFRRFSLDRYEPGVFQDFWQFILNLHHLFPTEIYISYADVHGDLLPINNDDNFCKAVSTAQTLLRIFIQLQEEMDQFNMSTNSVTRTKKSTITDCADVSRRGHVQIGVPQNFRPVSSIIDVDILPECHRRVRLYHQGSDRPLGFYIRDGITFSVTPHGLEKVPGIFISRLVPGGLAESCGLLAIDDQILEVNGIEVIGKTLDQVTDMMIANSHNLIITVKPANQSKNIRNPIISPNPELQLDDEGSISYPGLPMIMGAYAWTRNSSVSDDDLDIVVEKMVKPSSQCSSVTVSSPSSQTSIHNRHRLGHPSSQELCRSQPCLNYTAHSGSSISLQKEMSSQKHYRSNPGFRQNTFSTFDILGTLSPDLRQRLMIPQGGMEEDGTVITV